MRRTSPIEAVDEKIFDKINKERERGRKNIWELKMLSLVGRLVSK